MHRILLIVVLQVTVISSLYRVECATTTDSPAQVTKTVTQQLTTSQPNVVTDDTTAATLPATERIKTATTTLTTATKTPSTTTPSTATATTAATAATTEESNISSQEHSLPQPAALMSSELSGPGIEPTTSESPMVEDDILKKIKAKSGVNSAIDAILVLVVIQTMLGLGCTMDLTLISEHLLQPSGIAIAAACQFGFMPLIAFIMAKIFSLDKVAALAVLVTGCCPGGNLSNLLTYFLYGDMNLSILMSTASTLLALIFMPLCLFIYGSSWIEVSNIGQLVPFGGVVLTLFLTLFPVAIGIAIKARYEKIANTILKISLFSVMVSFVALMTLSIILFGTSIFSAISGTSYLIAFIMPLFGYGSGYLLATGFRLPDASRRTVAIETGCQNSQLSSTILKMAFASEAMGAYFLFPIYYALFQGLEGLGMIVAFRIYRRYHADQALAPTSRVTYDKFDDDEWGGEDLGNTRGGLPYQHTSRSNSDDSMTYGRLTLGEQENGGVRSQNVPDKLPLKHKFSPGEVTKRVEGGDKSSLLPSDQRRTSGLGDYGGLN